MEGALTAEQRAKNASERLLRTANNVVAIGRVVKSSYCDHSGWGLKQGSIIKSWKRRFFVLKGRELIYFEERSPSGKGINEKGRLKVVGVEFTPEFTNAFVVQGELKNQYMKVQVETNGESVQWFNKIKEAIQKDVEAAKQQGIAVGGAVTMEGWLMKEGQNFKTWKKRYMILCGRVIKYHAKPGEAPLGEAAVNDVNINPSRPFALDIYSDNNRIFRIAAESFTDISAWDAAIAKAIKKRPCFGEPFADQQAPFLGETFEQALLCEGWLYKRGQRSTAWQKRYFTLNGFTLRYRDGPGEHSKGRGMVIDIRMGDDISNSMDIQLDTGRTLSVSADSKAELEKWLNIFCDLLKKDPAVVQQTAAEAVVGRNGRAMSIGLLSKRKNDPNVASSAHDVASLLRRGFSNDNSESIRVKSGWLRKEGKRLKSWKRRYFVASDNTISYFEQVNEPPLGTGEVTNVTINMNYPNCLDIQLKSGRVLRVAAESPNEIISWYDHLKSDPQNAPKSSKQRALVWADSLGEQEIRISNVVENGAGWLLKKGHNFKSWKRRYFELEGKRLTYFRAMGDCPLGSGIIKSATVGNLRPFCLNVQFQNGRILHVVAANEAEMVAWNKAFYKAIQSQMQPEDLQGGEFDYDDNDDGDEGRRSSLSQESRDSSDKIIRRTSKAAQLNRGSSTESLYSDEAEPGNGETQQQLLSPANADANLVVCSGWLRKEGSTVKSWKVRYFTLHGTTLCYFKSDSGPLLRSLIVVHVVVLRTKKLCLEITTESGRKLLVAADSEADLDRWRAALYQALAADREKKLKLTVADKDKRGAAVVNQNDGKSMRLIQR